MKASPQLGEVPYLLAKVPFSKKKASMAFHFEILDISLQCHTAIYLRNLSVGFVVFSRLKHVTGQVS
jgi:hypothetical protein